jgi:protein-L-isoaspartate O-methyltransferase
MPSDMPRRFCCDEDLARIGYDGQDAADDVELWREHGPRAETQELIDVLLAEGVEGAALLDIGAGVGALHVSLLESGAASALDVDASPEYLDAAKDEAERRGLAGRIEYRYGDVVELADELPPADIVTADSVICCYPYLAPFLAAAVRRGPRLVGLTYINDTWWLRIWMRFWNLTWVLRRFPDRWCIHRHATVDRLMLEAGYRVIHDGGTWNWRVVVFRRDLLL